MSLPEPINWLHMSAPKYIYLVTSLAHHGENKFPRNPEPQQGLIGEFWDLKRYEFFTDKTEANERAKQICWPDDLVEEVVNTNLDGKVRIDSTKIKNLKIKNAHIARGMVIVCKYGIRSPYNSKDWVRQTYVIRVRNTYPR